MKLGTIMIEDTVKDIELLNELNRQLDEGREKLKGFEDWECIPDDKSLKSNSPKAVAYRRSASYLLLKQLLLRYYKHRCANCGATEKLQLHHVHYKNFFRERIEDCRILCQSCHQSGHNFKRKILETNQTNKGKKMNKKEKNVGTMMFNAICPILANNKAEYFNKEKLQKEVVAMFNKTKLPLSTDDVKTIQSLKKNFNTQLTSFFKGMGLVEQNSKGWKITENGRIFLGKTKDEINFLLKQFKNAKATKDMPESALDKKQNVRIHSRLIYCNELRKTFANHGLTPPPPPHEKEVTTVVQKSINKFSRKEMIYYVKNNLGNYNQEQFNRLNLQPDDMAILLN